MKSFDITPETLNNVDLHFATLKDKFIIATSQVENYIFFVFEPENPQQTNILGFKDINNVENIIGKHHSLLTLKDLRNLFKAELELEEIAYKTFNIPFDKLMLDLYKRVWGPEYGKQFYLEDTTPPKKRRKKQ